jgi:hypothetical protein
LPRQARRLTRSTRTNSNERAHGRGEWFCQCEAQCHIGCGNCAMDAPDNCSCGPSWAPQEPCSFGDLGDLLDRFSTSLLVPLHVGNQERRSYWDLARRPNQEVASSVPGAIAGLELAWIGLRRAPGQVQWDARLSSLEAYVALERGGGDASSKESYGSLNEATNASCGNPCLCMGRSLRRIAGANGRPEGSRARK